jgi:hypothetical protein
MGDRPKDIRRYLTVIEGGKKDTVIQDGKKNYAAAPQLCSEFNMSGFLSQGDTLDTKFEIPPQYYGKTVNGVQYGDPTKQPVLLYVDENNKPVFEY